MSPPDRRADDALDELFGRYAAQIRSYARRRIGDASADDVVTETFLIAWRRLDRMPETPLPWLLGIARHVMSNQQRAAVRRDRLAQRIAFHEPSASSDAATPEVGEVLRALAELSEPDLELVLLICWEGLSSREAAMVIGCTPVAARVRLHRARARLANALASEGSDIDESAARELEET